MSLADWLSGLNLRRRFRSHARRSRRRDGYRPDVAAEVSRLEDRCLLSHLLSFAGYGWSTDYHFNLVPGTGWYNNGQQWAPQNAFVQNGKLHLDLKTATVDGYTQLSSAEVDIVQKDGHPFNPGYGTYLVAAHHNGGFNLLGNNNTVAFGAFTYQKNADPSQINAQHELDMIEASRFGPPPEGWQGDVTNAQFTLQPWYYFTPSTHNNVNVHRITLGDNPNITLVMHWAGPATPVTFSEYDGTYKLNDLPKNPNITWTTTAQQNPLIPDSGQQTVHLNLWREPGDPNKPLHDDEVIVNNFQYQPLSSAAAVRRHHQSRNSGHVRP
jgi:hypothetical protein